MKKSILAPVLALALAAAGATPAYAADSDSVWLDLGHPITLAINPVVILIGLLLPAV